VKVKVTFDFSTAFTGAGLESRQQAIARLIKEQTLTRIQEGGDDELQFAPLDFARPTGDRDNPLYDTGTHLLDSITSGVDEDGPWVGSDFIGAAVHQFGTKGKGGKLPTIVPKQAKALFIPLTPLAARSSRVVENAKGKTARKTAVRRGGRQLFQDLEKGVDFLLVSKVDIVARPFLRVSRKNMQGIVQIIEEGD
jgi:phage gpG-like protein